LTGAATSAWRARRTTAPVWSKSSDGLPAWMSRCIDAVEPGATLALQAGSAWVTFEGDPDDHLLDGPASFTAPRRGRVALWALSPVRFELEPSAPRRAA